MFYFPIFNQYKLIIKSDPADIDFFAGGLSEQNTNSGPNATVIGPTFSCFLMKQFADLKNGDRFYYENGPVGSPTAFTLSIEY